MTDADAVLAELAAIAATLSLFDEAPRSPSEPPEARWKLAARLPESAVPLDALRRTPRLSPWRIAGRLLRD